MKRAGIRCSTTSITGSQARVSLSTTRGSRAYQCISAWTSMNESPGPGVPAAHQQRPPGVRVRARARRSSIRRPQHPPGLAEEHPQSRPAPGRSGCPRSTASGSASRSPRPPTARTARPAARSRRSGRGSATHSSRSARQRPGQQRRERGGADQPQRQRHARRSTVSATTAGATTQPAQQPGQRRAPVELVEVGQRWRRTSRRCAAATPREVPVREQRVVARGGAAGRAARAPRRRRAARPARGGSGAAGRSRTTPAPPPTAGAAPQRPVDPARPAARRSGSAPSWTARPTGIEFTMPPSRKCSSPTRAGGSRPGTAALATHRVDQRAGVEPVLGGPLDARRAHLEAAPAGPRRSGRRAPRRAAVRSGSAE